MEASEVIEITQNATIPNMPAAGKILVNIKAAGVNPVDWKIREGYFQQMMRLQFPFTLGMDFFRYRQRNWGRCVRFQTRR